MRDDANRKAARVRARRILPDEEEHYSAMYEDTGAQAIASDLTWEIYRRGLTEIPVDILTNLICVALDDRGYIIVRKTPPPEPHDDLFQPGIQTEAEARRAGDERDRERFLAGAQGRAGTTKPGWIYYLRVGNKVKIGYSATPDRRLKAYPPDSKLLAIHPGTKQTESDMHRRFRHALVAGREWFKPDDLAVCEHIASVVREYGRPPRGLQPQYRRSA